MQRGPAKLSPIWPLLSASYYLHVGLATLVLGLWGLPKALFSGREGAQRVATVWIDHMLRAARWHFGLTVEVRGTPPSGHCIVAAKHQSFLDILALARACPDRAFIMKREIMRVPIMGWFARKVGSVPIDRKDGRGARAAMIAAVHAALPRGLGQLIIYPEGTRTRPGTSKPYKNGAAMLYQETGLPLVPVACDCGLFWPKGGLRIHGGRAVIEFLPAIPPGDTASAAALTDRLEAMIEPAARRLLEEACAARALPVPRG